MRILIVRHAKQETEVSPETPERLSTEGIEQAHSLQYSLARLELTNPVVYSSPYRRAIQTAEVALSIIPNILITKKEELRNCGERDQREAVTTIANLCCETSLDHDVLVFTHHGWCKVLPPAIFRKLFSTEMHGFREIPNGKAVVIQTEREGWGYLK